jgi:hypothetical protein
MSLMYGAAGTAVALDTDETAIGITWPVVRGVKMP